MSGPAIKWWRCGHTAYQVHDSLRLIPGGFVRCTRRALHLGEHHWPEVDGRREAQ